VGLSISGFNHRLTLKDLPLAKKRLTSVAIRQKKVLVAEEDPLTINSREAVVAPEGMLDSRNWGADLQSTRVTGLTWRLFPVIITI
jgi:hypothetical protein